jgi:hypothetical protein
MTASTARVGCLLGLTLGILAWSLPSVSKSPTPPDPVAVEIVSTFVQNERTSAIHLTLRFTNRTDASIFLLKPLEGSDRDAHMPYYRYRVTDRSGDLIRGGGYCNCGGILWSATTWPEDYLVEIRPGTSFDHRTRIRPTPAVAGPHKVDFEYVYLPNEDDYPSPPQQAWRGILRAKPVMVDCQPDPTIPFPVRSKGLERGK